MKPARFFFGIDQSKIWLKSSLFSSTRACRSQKRRKILIFMLEQLIIMLINQDNRNGSVLVFPVAVVRRAHRIRVLALFRTHDLQNSVEVLIIWLVSRQNHSNFLEIQAKRWTFCKLSWRCVCVPGTWLHDNWSFSVVFEKTKNCENEPKHRHAP